MRRPAPDVIGDVSLAVVAELDVRAEHPGNEVFLPLDLEARAVQLHAEADHRTVRADEIAHEEMVVPFPPFPVYIGVGHNLAYLENRGRFRGIRSPKTIVYWTELDELPDELAARLKAGENPWASPDKKRN